MELLAAIAGLEALTCPCSVKLHSDSKYVVDSVNNGSVIKWRDNNWFRTPNHKAKNADLWDRFLAAYEKHEVQLIWVRGHTGIMDNERCDQLAVDAARATNLLEDTGYTDTVEELVPTSITTKRSIPKARKPGDPCRKCETPLVKRKPKKRRQHAAYHYEWYLYCEACGTMYMIEEAKRYA